MSAWTNWSGALQFLPERIEHPADEADMIRLVGEARDRGLTLRPVGAGHSSMPLVETNQLLVSLDRLHGLTTADAAAGLASVRAGTRLHELTQQLLEHGLSLENLGDVDVQTIGGAVATGTHGSGIAWGSLADPVVGLRFIDGRGELVECSAEQQPELLRAGRVSLGLLGIFASITLRVLPAFRLLALRTCLPIETCLGQLDELIAQHAYLDFYLYPRRDEADVRAKDPTLLTEDDVPSSRARRVGWMRDVIPNTRTLKFNEMEYAVPREAGPECFRAVRRRIQERHLKTVAWRVLYRTVAAEDAYLSPSFERDSVTISIHQNAHLPYREFFADIEPIFRSFDGRPHWAKINMLPPHELRDLYPAWDDFCAIRRKHDPEGRFLNDYLRRLFE